MTLQKRIEAFDQLGSIIKNLSDEDFLDLTSRVENNNNWFTPFHTKNALNSLASYLNSGTLSQWIAKYNISDQVISKSIGILMAGNIPAVGFHDLLCVLISGHKACIKMSTSDTVLMKWLINNLISINPDIENLISVEEMLKGKDAYIATGSDNSARYFDYYFDKYPHIIRRNRTSVGILDGKETSQDYLSLAKDIFLYYGLGCRNVSKIYVPNKESMIPFLDAIVPFSEVAANHKYFNNYEYNKSILLVNKELHLDNGFLLVQESQEIVSPISVLYYETYESEEELRQKIKNNADKTQCVLSRSGWFEGSEVFGLAQCPTVEEYADGIDTMAFLANL